MNTSEIIRRVKEIQIRTGRQVADVLAGGYVSVFKGGGIEFEEVRPYTPGDDIRSIDWNVTARTGEPFVKRFVEERQLTLMLMADVSASQDFGSGTRTKRDAAAEFCALLAFSAIRNDDKVGLVLFHGAIEQYIPPRKGQKHALRVVREVLAHGQQTPEELEANATKKSPYSKKTISPSRAPAVLSAAPLQRFVKRLRSGVAGKRLRSAQQSTNIEQAMEFLLSVSKRKSVCFVVSDFFDDNYEKSLMTANRKHDVIAVLITDPRELEVPSVGLVALQDAETETTRLYDTGSKVFRDTLAEAAQQRIAKLEHRMRSRGIDFIHIDAAGSVVDPLVKFFRMREKRAHR